MTDLKLFWNRLTLAQQFAVTCFPIVVAGMLAIGWWVSVQIERGVVQNTAVTTALYMNSFVAPEVSELEKKDWLSPGSIATLERLHRGTPLGRRIVSLKIWGPGGRVVYSSHPSLVGRVFPVTPSLRGAWNGEVKAELSELGQEEDELERIHFGTRLLEVYSPIRAEGSDRIISVAEFYEAADDLDQQLFEAQVSSWVVVAAVTLTMFALLFSVVRGGSQTITRQQRELTTRIRELSALLKQNEELNERVRRATNRTAEVNERFLRRVSAELHDGPAQALGYALLRLDSVKQNLDGCEYTEQIEGCPYQGTVSDNGVLDSIRSSLNEALQEIRNLSTGLALPELGKSSLRQALNRLVRSHERRTSTKVNTKIGDVDIDLPLPAKIGIYRFVQEALHNAFRHGAGQNVCLEAATDESGVLMVEVSDEGPGFDLGTRVASPDHLGLVGMRERIESLGGEFQVNSAPGQGTRVTARLSLNDIEEDD